MSEWSRRFTERELEKLSQDIGRVYKEAQKDILRKLAAWTARHRARAESMLADVNAGKIPMEKYQKWLRGQVFVGRQWRMQEKEISAILVDADREAARLINTGANAVFIENANYAAYQLEKSLGGIVNFSLYNEQTVAGLIARTPELLPRRVIDGAVAEAWQTKQIANAVAQSIIQGEGIPDISKRIARDTGINAGKASTRYARTAMTGAQNAGRQARMEEAEEELEDTGIEVMKRWDATLDDRTRDAHQDLDGVTIPVDEAFHNEFGDIMFPGDPHADGANVWNCRCTISYVYPSIPVSRQRRAYRTVTDDNGKEHRESYIVGNVTYKEWKEGKGAVQK